MREMDYFRLPGSAIQYPLTAANKIFDDLDWLTIQGPRTLHIDAHGGRSIEGSAVSGTAFSTASSNEYGWRADVGTVAGHAAGRLFCINAGSPFPTLSMHNLAISWGGYRNINILAGTKGWFVFGTQATVTDLASLPGKCFGVEFALGTDVGSPDGITGVVFRLFAHNGTSVVNGRWRRMDAAGDGGSSAAGAGFGFLWERATAMLHLVKGSMGGAAPTYRAASLHVPEFLVGTLQGHWAGIGVSASGTGGFGTRVAVGHASAMWQQDSFAMPYPFGRM
jgi:hypothetical protein